MKITPKYLSRGQYIAEQWPKKQIYLHHTVSTSAESALSWWSRQPQRIATAFLIERSGEIIAAFPSSEWAYHLGVNDVSLEQQSVGIELVAGGPVHRDRAVWRTGFGAEVAPAEVVMCPWRQVSYWQGYTPEQIGSLMELLSYLCGLYQIPGAFREDMWNGESVSQAAISGEPGIWSHASVRADKTDAYPQPSLVAALKKGFA
jgi:N-acetyl-anhydromuramyl-L-alanine amidase AmpD